MDQKLKNPGKQCIMDGRAAVRACANQIYDNPSPPSDISSAIGFALTGQRTGCFISAKNLVHAHDSLYAAAGKHLPIVVNLECGAIQKSSHSSHAGHDAYHAVSDTGLFQFFAKNVQEVADLNLIAHRIAELALVPGLVAQDEILTTETTESLFFPETKTIIEYLGRSSDKVEPPTPSQKLLYGKNRRRIPELWDVNRPLMSGTTQSPDGYVSSVAAQRPFYAKHVIELTKQAIKEYNILTGRIYSRVGAYKAENADYIIIGQGRAMETAEVVADYFRNIRRINVGAANISMLRPFPGDILGHILKNKKGAVVIECLDQPLAEDPPIMREVRSAIHKCLENAETEQRSFPYPDYAVYEDPVTAPKLYSASYGTSLQAGDLIRAVENMLPMGEKKKRFYLGINFLRTLRLTPQQEVQQHAILDAYPKITNLTIREGKNPSLLPKDALTVLLLSKGKENFSKTGQALAVKLFDLLKTNLKGYQASKLEPAGQTVKYCFTAASEPIKVDCASFPVNVVICLDPDSLHQPKILSNLNEGGAIVIQSSYQSPDETWKTIPENHQRTIIDRKIRTFAIDFQKIIGESGDDPETTAKVLLGSLLATSEISKPGKEGMERWTETVKEGPVKRGIAELVEIREKQVLSPAGKVEDSPLLPPMLKDFPKDESPVTDIHRFWVQTGHPHSLDSASQDPADPFLATGTMPAATGIFSDTTSIRSQHPQWIPEKCTGCGDCWVVCPDSALPPLVNETGEIFETIIKRLETAGHEIKHLERGVRSLDGTLNQLISRGKIPDTLRGHLDKAIEQTVNSSGLPPHEKERLTHEFNLFKKEIKDFQFAVTKSFYGDGKGGLLSITLNPGKCKGCMECVKECKEEALAIVNQTDQTLASLRKNINFWQNLPNTNRKFIQTENLEKDNAYTTLFLDKKAYHSMVGGDNAAPGSAKKTVIHLFSGIVESQMHSRRIEQRTRINDLAEQLEKHIKLKLAPKVEDTAKLNETMDLFKDRDFTLAELSEKLDGKKDPVDSVWLARVSKLLSGLKEIQSIYSEENDVKCAGLGMVGSPEEDLSWASTFPYNPFSFPWTQNLLGDSPSIAAGLFEGHMKKMADIFKTIRMTDLELSEKYNSNEHDTFFENFGWKDLTDEELRLSPPVIIVGDSNTIYRHALQNLNKILGEKIPVKVLLLDTLKTPAHFPLTGMVDQNTYIFQGGMGNVPHLIKGIIDGFQTKRPALFHVFCSNVPEQGIITDSAVEQARLALKSRACPAFTCNPDSGNNPTECLSLDGNADINKDYILHPLEYINDEGKKALQEVPYTFADFAITEGSFQNCFKKLSDKDQGDLFVPIIEFLEMDKDDKQGKTPFVWSVDKNSTLCRFAVSDEMIKRCENNKAFWNLLKSLKRMDLVSVSEEDIKKDTQKEMIEKITEFLVEIAQGNGGQDDFMAKFARPV